MTNQKAVAECAIDVLVTFPESVQIFTGLLTALTVSGGLLGIVTAALLYVFCLKPMLLTRQGNNARRLLEPVEENVDNHQSDHISNNRKDVTSSSAAKEKKMPPINSDVAAFASRAKVVYPINQKYRPLADGASNPSVHERSKLPAGSNEDSSTGESLSQEQDNDDSSQFISSSLVPRSLQNQSFSRAPHYPHTLTQTGFEGRIGLYCLALQDVQQQCCGLQEEKCQIFLRMVKMIFSQRFPKNKNEEDFFKNLIVMQEKEVDTLRKRLTAKTASEKTAETDSPCTLEEIERTHKDLLEHGLQMTEVFGQQVEHLCQHLLGKDSVLPTEEAHAIINSLIHTLVLLENHWMAAQEAGLKSIQQRLLWWEELMYLFQAKPALLRQEVSLRQALVATALEQLSGEDTLTFDLMEKMLSEMQCSLKECLELCTEDCVKKAKELASEKWRRTESKSQKLQSSQARERSQALDSAQAHGDLHHFIKVYKELQAKHRQQSISLELKQDDRVVEALCDLWRKLHSSWSRRVGEEAKKVFLGSLAPRPQLSVEHCSKLWLDLEDKLATQRQQAEVGTKMQLEDMRAQMDQDRQLWGEETAVVLACLRHLTEQQMKMLQTTVVRQSYMLDRPVGMLLEKKQERLLVAVQTHFVSRHFCLHVLREMRLSKLKALAQTDFRDLLREDHNQSQENDNSATKDQRKDSGASLAERHLGAESQLVDHSFQQEFLSELETGTELLQRHAQLLVGNALSHRVWGRMGATAPLEWPTRPQHTDGLKHHLAEVASESVYLTKDSLSALVQGYYSHMEDVTTRLQEEQSSTRQSVRDENARRESSHLFHQGLLRELANWEKNLTSKEFQKRVEQHKRKLLEHYDLGQEVLFDTLRQHRVSEDQAMEKVKAQLLEAEENFITEVAALARVSLQNTRLDPTIQEENSGVVSHDIMNLLALNPDLDPAKNPSLTPTVVATAPKAPQKKNRERESQLI
ncbi:evC complex member EVC-like isoform X2 [Gadus chalcogrammus]|uniref:evC complex member EVC-like isoform X2 n=1 Tax=Gadus chalcogrammus TaxID=1042646 RepID=UPI0024C4C722|nr:evC complex member EVC-like isoform X2 [Gadus chalcogrammus]